MLNKTKHSLTTTGRILTRSLVVVESLYQLWVFWTKFLTNWYVGGWQQLVLISACQNGASLMFTQMSYFDQPMVSQKAPQRYPSLVCLPLVPIQFVCGLACKRYRHLWWARVNNNWPWSCLHHRKSAIHGLIIKSEKSECLKISERALCPCLKIETGQNSRSLVLTKRIVAPGDENWIRWIGV